MFLKVVFLITECLGDFVKHVSETYQLWTDDWGGPA